MDDAHFAQRSPQLYRLSSPLRLRLPSLLRISSRACPPLDCMRLKTFPFASVLRHNMIGSASSDQQVCSLFLRLLPCLFFFVHAGSSEDACAQVTNSRFSRASSSSTCSVLFLITTLHPIYDLFSLFLFLTRSIFKNTTSF